MTGSEITLSDRHERVSPFLASTRRHDSSRHHMRVRDQVADDLVVHGIGVFAAGLRHARYKKPGGNLAHRQMRPSLEHGVERVAEARQHPGMRSRVVHVARRWFVVWGSLKLIRCEIVVPYFVQTASLYANTVAKCRSTMTMAESESSGEKLTISTEGGNEPVWSRNGRELFYR
jgi:hypothetical protein